MTDLKLFYSYCHIDEPFRIELEKWLTTLRNDGLIAEWHDRKISAGQSLNTEIDRHLRDANIVLLLLSQDFIASAACSQEMAFALSMQDSKRVISVILKQCTWKETECRTLLALPKDGSPIESWESREEAWLDVFNGIKRTVKELLQSYIVKDEFNSEIQQVEFISQNKRKVLLNDIFVFPFLVTEKDPETRVTLGYDYFLKLDSDAVIVTGEELSGKTSLLRVLYTRLRERYSTIILDGQSIFKSLNFEDLFRKEFAKQMTGDFEEWLRKDNKVVLIDDFHHRISHKIMTYLTENFTKVIVTIDRDEYLVFFKDDPSFANFTVTTLRPFPRSKQENLIRKWMHLSDKKSQLPELYDLSIDKIEEKVNSIISVNQIVPRYPFYILTILQSSEAFMPRDYSITAYGHCYHALITAQLVKKEVKPGEIDSCFNFLTELAYDIYQHSCKNMEYGRKEYLAFTGSYKTNFFILESTVNRLESVDYPILRIGDGDVRFEYPYIYYFFLGKRMAAKVETNEIDDICSNIHKKENAFILIFTIHHAQTKALLDTILLHCICSFDKVAPAELTTEETRFMEDLISDLPKSIISSKSVSETRREEREVDLSELDETVEQQEEDVDLREISRAMKIIEVLGQILKNRSGSFDKPSVMEIAENTINLGLRILNFLLGDCRKPEFTIWLQKRLEEAEKDSQRTWKQDDDRRLKFVQRTIQLFGYIITIGMLSKISYSIRTDKLVDAILSLCIEKNTPAYKMIGYLVLLSQRGLDVTILKELVEEFERTKNYWAQKTMSFYIQNYLNTHNVDFRDRQRVFQLLGLKYIPNK